MKKWFYILISSLVLTSLTLTSCQSGSNVSSEKKSIVVTYSILGSIVKDLVGDQANVIVPMPNGQDPHDWEPSAKDIEAINKADMVVQNGLDLEAGMQKTLETARNNGVKIFAAADHITVRHVGQGEGIPSGDPDQQIGAPDPHLWMDPLTIRSLVTPLADEIKKDLKLDVTGRAADLENRLDNLNKQVTDITSVIPKMDRKLVTGHESLGYFAQRYEFRLVGVIVPSLTTQAEVSAADLAELKKTIQENQVKVIFTELGTSPAVANTIGQETGVKVVELTTHSLPADGSYFTFITNMAKVITNGLE
jgi:zinc/manganese transport system substrate-binding protein